MYIFFLNPLKMLNWPRIWTLPHINDAPFLPQDGSLLNDWSMVLSVKLYWYAFFISMCRYVSGPICFVENDHQYFWVCQPPIHIYIFLILLQQLLFFFQQRSASSGKRFLLICYLHVNTLILQHDTIYCNIHFAREHSNEKELAVKSTLYKVFLCTAQVLKLLSQQITLLYITEAS